MSLKMFSYRVLVHETDVVDSADEGGNALKAGVVRVSKPMVI